MSFSSSLSPTCTSTNSSGSSPGFSIRCAVSRGMNTAWLRPSSSHLGTAGHPGAAAHDHPVLLAVVVQLQRQDGAGIDRDPLDREAVAGVEHLPAAPGPVVTVAAPIGDLGHAELLAVRSAPGGVSHRHAVGQGAPTRHKRRSQRNSPAGMVRGGAARERVSVARDDVPISGRPSRPKLSSDCRKNDP